MVTKSKKPVVKSSKTQTPSLGTPARRNGYYFHPLQNRYYPSVTTVSRIVGDKGGLLRYFAREGARGVLQELIKIKNKQTLFDKLDSKACLEWAMDIGVAAADAASEHSRNFGTAIHAALEEYVQSGKVERARAFVDWSITHEVVWTHLERFFQQLNPVIIATEREVFHPMAGYAGRLDLLIRVSKEKAETYIKPHTIGTFPNFTDDTINLVVDLKTGSLYPKEHRVQLAAYQEAVTNDVCFSCKVHGALVVGVERKEPDKVKVYAFGPEELHAAYTDVFYPALKQWVYYSAPKWYLEQ